MANSEMDFFFSYFVISSVPHVTHRTPLLMETSHTLLSWKAIHPPSYIEMSQLQLSIEENKQLMGRSEKCAITYTHLYIGVRTHAKIPWEASPPGLVG